MQAPVTLGLVIPAEHRERAVTLLAARGFAAQRNSSHVLVQARAGRNAEPVQVLVAAGIPVIDVEWADGDVGPMETQR